MGTLCVSRKSAMNRTEYRVIIYLIQKHVINFDIFYSIGDWRKIMTSNNWYENAKRILNELRLMKTIPFGTLKPSMISSEIEGVYIIENVNNGRVLYVGRSVNLRRRLYTNHLQGNSSTARLKKYLVESESYHEIGNFSEAKEWIKTNCGFRYVEISDYKDRGRIEGLLSFVLDVEFIHKEH